MKRIGMIVAMRQEAEELLSAMTEKEEKIVSGVTYTEGKLEGKDVVVAVCGIGKVFAAICAQTMILTYHPDFLINTGVGGALTGELHCGDLAVAEFAVQHDMDTSAIGDPVGLISGINLIRLPCDETLCAQLIEAAKEEGIPSRRGGIASGDRFIASIKDKEAIREAFDTIVCEMEGASIAQTCYVNKTPCVIMRAVSDSLTDDSSMEYEKFVPFAAERAVRTIRRFLRNN